MLAFADNSTVVLRNTTQLKIASFFTEGGVVRTEILLKMGEVAAKVNKSEATKSDFRIKDPTATASVRGTSFTVFYDPVARDSVVSVRTGVVDVDPARAGLPTVSVPAGKGVEVTRTTIGKIVPAGQAGVPAGAVSRSKARQLVLAQVARNDERCRIEVTSFGLRPAGKGWKVSVRIARRSSRHGDLGRGRGEGDRLEPARDGDRRRLPLTRRGLRPHFGAGARPG